MNKFLAQRAANSLQFSRQLEAELSSCRADLNNWRREFLQLERALNSGGGVVSSLDESGRGGADVGAPVEVPWSLLEILDMKQKIKDLSERVREGEHELSRGLRIAECSAALLVSTTYTYPPTHSPLPPNHAILPRRRTSS